MEMIIGILIGIPIGALLFAGISGLADHARGISVDEVQRMSERDLRYLYRKQESTGIFIQEHGPYCDFETAAWASKMLACGPEYKVGICTSEDGREVITEYSK
jgi:hypothetical protein